MEQQASLAAIGRYPVKSLVGEDLDSAIVDERGLVGDRLWAVRDVDGKLGSGKSTRRFRRMPGLLELTARYEHQQTPVVDFPNGRTITGDAPEIHEALSAHVGRAVALARESDVSHFDEAALHVVTTSSLARLGELHGCVLDVRRFRANLVIDTGTGTGPGFDEHDWVGTDVSIGAQVVLRIRKPMVRCVMVGLAQADLAADGQLLNTVGRVNETELGLVADVLSPGLLRRHDEVRAVSAGGAILV